MKGDSLIKQLVTDKDIETCDKNVINSTNADYGTNEDAGLFHVPKFGSWT